MKRSYERDLAVFCPCHVMIHVCVTQKWNPHPCGYYGDMKRECRCSTRQIENYRQEISGPLSDRRSENY